MKRSFAACAGMLICVGAGAAELAYTVRPTELKAKPFADAATLGNLAESSKVDVLERQGSWRQVKANANTGWVKLLSLRFDSSKALAATAAYTTGQSGGGSTATSAVKGLDLMAGLSKAEPTPNVEALKQMEKIDFTDAEIKAFTDAGKLAPVSFNFKAGAK